MNLASGVFAVQAIEDHAVEGALQEVLKSAYV